MVGSIDRRRSSSIRPAFFEKSNSLSVGRSLVKLILLGVVLLTPNYGAAARVANSPDIYEGLVRSSQACEEQAINASLDPHCSSSAPEPGQFVEAILTSAPKNARNSPGRRNFARRPTVWFRLPEKGGTP